MMYGGEGTNISHLDIFIDDSAWKINCQLLPIFGGPLIQCERARFYTKLSMKEEGTSSKDQNGSMYQPKYVTVMNESGSPIVAILTPQTRFIVSCCS